jgi:hypothetical protein
LFANVVAHFGINYMAQMMMSLFPLLACISVATFEAKQARARRAEAPAQEELAPVLAAEEAYRSSGEKTEEQQSSFAASRRFV